jgi:hypothetical protein
MNETQQSLLLRTQNGEQDAWKDLTGLYRPLILGWLQRQGVPSHKPAALWTRIAPGSALSANQ